jgi:hypothetical protein
MHIVRCHTCVGCRQVDVNARNDGGLTPLLVALQDPDRIDHDTIEWLIRAGADTSLRAKDGTSVLRLCLERPTAAQTFVIAGWTLGHHEDVVNTAYAELQHLVQAYEDVCHREAKLFYAAARQGEEALRLLTSLGGDVNVRFRDHEIGSEGLDDMSVLQGTAVSLATINGDSVAVEELLAISALLDLTC